MSPRKALGWFVLKLFGWKVEGSAPEHDKYIFICAPHTSNWDFVFILAYGYYFGVNISWLGKRQMFQFPFRGILRALGGVPVERSKSTNMVDQIAGVFAEREQFALGVPVEGTRGYVEYWKSGFYHMARAAGVPIVISYLDWGPKRGGFGPALTPSGNISADMDFFRDFYEGMVGKYPEKTGRIRLREEDEAAAVAGA